MGNKNTPSHPERKRKKMVKKPASSRSHPSQGVTKGPLTHASVSTSSSINAYSRQAKHSKKRGPPMKSKGVQISRNKKHKVKEQRRATGKTRDKVATDKRKRAKKKR